MASASVTTAVEELAVAAGREKLPQRSPVASLEVTAPPRPSSALSSGSWLLTMAEDLRLAAVVTDDDNVVEEKIPAFVASSLSDKPPPPSTRPSLLLVRSFPLPSSSSYSSSSCGGVGGH